ncbi:MAG: ABC transporter permease [Oscillospiraceae bacterium]|jgi:ABC-type transport system involved in multi-copper enzyme maturation permease subunit|nr:ABC transporter permease [Oscillospiraceae bacterium]
MSALLKYETKRLIRSRIFWFSFLLVMICAISVWIGVVYERNNWPIDELPWRMPYHVLLDRFEMYAFCAVFIAVFTTSEFSQGTIKNVISKGYTKTQVYLSKLGICYFAAIVIILVVTALNLIMIAFISQFAFASEINWVRHYLREFLLFFVLTVGGTFISQTIRNVVGSMVCALLSLLLIDIADMAPVVPKVTVVWLSVSLSAGLVLFNRRDIC